MRAAKAKPRRPGAPGSFSRRAGLFAVLPLYLFTLAFVAGPLVYMVGLSFMRRSGAWGVSAVFSLRSYARILEPIYLETFFQSIRLALFSTVLVVLIGYPFGYFMAKLRPRWRNRTMMLLIIPFWTSALMRIYGWMIMFRANGVLDSALLALGIIKSPLKLLYSYSAVLSGMVYALVPFMIYSVQTSAEKLDWSLVEAARDLGASPIQAFLTVSLPLTMPGLFSGVVLTFIPSMGIFFLADILGGNKIVLVGNLIQEQLMKAHDWPFAAALSVVLMIMTSIFLYLYRRLTRSGELEGLV
ncbi:MAG: ABC transporter permease [Treponema sp.]|jgi:spermidine/putrescine transport system permease protein|nr:ABC transporter permease [Treponema sp.]